MNKKPLILFDPFPRTKEMVFTSDVEKELNDMSDLVTHFGKRAPESIVEQSLPDVEIIIGQTDMPKERLNRAPKLKAIINVKANWEPNIDYFEAQRRGIYVLSVAPAMAPAVAEACIGYAIALARGTMQNYKNFLRGSEKYGIAGNTNAYTLFNSSVGFIGFGNLAQSLVPLLKPFNCKISVYDPWLSDRYLETQGVKAVNLDEVLSTNKFLFILTGVTSENESLRDQLQDHIQMLETQRAELRELKAEYQDKLEEQHQKLTSIIKSQSELVDKNSDLSEHYHRKELQLKELGERYEQAKDEAAKLKSKLEANMAKREADLIAELEEFKTKYKTDIDKINQESVAQIEEIKAQNAERIKELEVKLELRERQLKNNTAGVKVVEKIVEKKVFDDQEMQKFKAEMEAQLAAKDKRIKELLSKQKVIANKYKEDFSKAQSAFENYQSVIHKQKQKELALNENFEQVKSDLALERSKAQRLEQLMNQQDALNEIADEKVKVQDDFVAFKELGKLFEISNAKHWEIRSDVYKDTKFTLTQMRELIENDEIDGETFVKREGKWWKKAKEVHELFLELREREEKGEIRYYIERQSLRVPCGDKVEILTERSEFAGVCINLSTGGCLISVQDLNTNIFKESQEITIVFMSESLLFEFEIIGTIRNVDVRDKTLGIQFVDITDEEFDTIAFYIDSFADKLEQEAA